jgi:hypothetical protein
MAANTKDEESLQGLNGGQIENTPVQSIDAVEPGNTISKQESGDMEVHHHPDLHHTTKKWKEYVLEFLMIFLAVTMGFFAESYREHNVEKEKEKQSIESIIKAIASDTVQLKGIEAANRKALTYLDRLLQLKDSDITVPQTKLAFYLNALNGAYVDVYFRSNDAAFQQLLSTGSLGLIGNQHIVDSLFQYQQNTSLILRQENDHYFFSKNIWGEIAGLIDVSFIRSTDNKVNVNSINSFNLPQAKDLVLNYDKKEVGKLYNDVSALAVTTEIYTRLIDMQLKFGRQLVTMLRAEYHLDQE